MIFLLSLLWPMGAYIYSLRDVRTKGFVVASLFMAIMLGLTVEVYAFSGYNSDIIRNLQRAADAQYYTWIQIFLEKDFFLSVSGKLLCMISDNLRFLAVCYYILYTILFLLGFRIIIQKYEQHRVPKYFIYALFLITPFTFFNSLRFAFGTFYFIWCMLEIFFNQRKLFYGLILLTLIFHFSFFILLPLPFLYFYLKNKIKILWCIFIMSLIFQTASTSTMINKFAENNLSKSVSSTVSIYASEDGRETMIANYEDASKKGNDNRKVSRFLVDVRAYVIMSGVVLLSLLLYRKNHKDKKATSYFTLIILLFSLANIVASASNGERFYHVTSLFSLYMLFAFLMEDGAIKIYHKYKYIFNTLFIVGILYGVVFIYISRIGYSFIELFFSNVIFTVIGNII